MARPFGHNRHRLEIASGTRQSFKRCKNRKLTWGERVGELATPLRHAQSVSDYESLPKT